MLSQYPVSVLGACLSLVGALPKVSFPLAEQIPPAPVAGQTFSFTFSPQTFESAKSLEYSLINSPGWLRLDSSSRTLQGTPSAADIGATSLQIQATDIEGSISTELSLTVLATNSVKVRQDIVEESLARTGSISAPLTLSLYPQTEFNLDFGSSVFAADTNDVYYFASSEGHTPLPAWVSFNTDAVSFSGRTPTLLTPQSSPQMFGFGLAAGQGRGVAQAAFNFVISVTNHIFQFLDASRSYQLVPSEHLVIESLLPSLRRDGASVAATQITYQSSNQPDWLTLNLDDLSFSGVVPPSPITTQFQLFVTDDQNNIAAIEIKLHYDDQSLESPSETLLPAVDAIRKQAFSYTFNATSGPSSLLSTDIALSTAQSWLKWVPQNLTVMGTVPDSKQISSSSISLTIKKDGKVDKILRLTINFIDGPSTSNPKNASSTRNPNATSTPSDGDVPGKSEPGLNHKDLALKIALPLIAVALLLCIILLILRWMRKHRSRTAMTEVTDGVSDSTHDQASVRQSSSGNIVVIGHSSTTESLRDFLASSPPPRIDMTWSAYQRPLSRLFSRSSRDDKTTPTTRSSWSDMLNEFDSPIYYGHYNRIDDPGASFSNVSLPPAPTKVKHLTKQHAVTSNVRDIDMQKHSTSVRTSKFNGRRKSGLGHGTNATEPGPTAHRGTLRQVPLSPLSESPTLNQCASTIPARRQLALNGSSSRMMSAMDRLRYSASGSSRYDDPDLESSQGSYFQGENSVKLGWDDRDWLTMSNDSGSQKSADGGNQQEASRGSNGLPPPFSSGMAVLGDQSQTNSLRFI